MLRFFRINDPYRLLFIFVILIVVRVVQGYAIPGTSYFELKWLLLGEWLGNGYSMYNQTYDYTGPLAAMVFKGLNFLFGRSPLAGQILSSLLIIFQAGIFNSLLLKNKVYDENGYLPALLYVLLAVSIPDFMVLSPQLMCTTFVLLALRNVFRRIGNQVTDELFLSSGIYIGIAAMIYLPAGVFFFVFLFSLILFSTAIPRRLLLYFFGFLLVFVVCGVYFYLFDAYDLFVSRAIFRGILVESNVSLTIMELLVIGAPFAVILVLSIIQRMGALRMTNFQQKVDQVVWILFFGGLATMLISNERAAIELIFITPVVAYFWTYYFVLLKRRFFKAIMPALLVFGLLFYSGFIYRNWTSSLLVDTSESGGNGMVLGTNLESYASQPVASPFFNNEIAQDLHAELDQYEQAERFYQLLQEIDPVTIEDEMGIMPKLLHRFPYLEINYTKTGEGSYRKISN